MKILFISNLFPPHSLGGYEILCGQVGKALEQRGHEVIVLTSTHGQQGHLSSEQTTHINRVLKLYLPFEEPPRLLRKQRWQVGKCNYRRTMEVILRERPDVIFVWSQLRLTLGASQAAQNSGIPVVYTFNDEHIAGYLPARPGLSPRACARYVADNWVFPSITLQGLRFSHATCISQRLKQNLLDHGVPIREAKVIYQGIPLEQFSAKLEMGLMHTPIRLLYVGQLHPYKGVHTLIEAANRIAACQGAHALRVSVIGDGPETYKCQLRNQARQQNTHVDFVGKVPHAELTHIYQEHDIFVFPSIWQEPFGLTHLEAMASGTPVISTADGGHGEFLNDGENALIFAKEDASQLASHILRLRHNPELSTRLAVNARAMVEHEFRLARYVADLEALLHEAVERKEP